MRPTASKGVFGGPCNRTACQQPGAVWYNQSTRAYYCPACAAILNGVNQRDATRLFDTELCVDTDHPAHPHAGGAS